MAALGHARRVDGKWHGNESDREAQFAARQGQITEDQDNDQGENHDPEGNHLPGPQLGCGCVESGDPRSICGENCLSGHEVIVASEDILEPIARHPGRGESRTARSYGPIDRGGAQNCYNM